MSIPDISEAQFFQGAELMQSGEFAQAETCFAKAIELAPDFAEAYANLGWLQQQRGDIQAAEISYRRSIDLNPQIAESHLNLGALLTAAKRFPDAEAAYLKAIELKPHCPQAWSNLGVLYAGIRRDVDAERCQRTAMFLDPSYALARFNLSYLLLRQGRFEEGWSCLEARDWYAGLADYLTVPRWRGEALAGKTLLICFEAGLGDMIQFCRYAAVLKAQGAASITLLCHPPLKKLLETVAGIDHLIGYDETLPQSGWDYWTPLLSIPGYCNTRIDTIPADIPYLHAQQDLIEKWAALLPNVHGKNTFFDNNNYPLPSPLIKPLTTRLSYQNSIAKSLLIPHAGEGAGLRVGLVWKGNPLFENDADRSLPSLETLAPLWQVPGVCYISLQKGEGENEAAPGLPLARLGPQLTDFTDTAALVANLDLVISVDTAVAHLAGALGKPCWLLLPDYKTDWRWLNDRTDTPWYPGVMRLYRQTSMGDWNPVIARVADDLKQLALELNSPNKP